MDDTGENGHHYAFRVPDNWGYFNVYAWSFEDAKNKLQEVFPDSKWQVCIRFSSVGTVEQEWMNGEHIRIKNSWEDIVKAADEYCKNDVDTQVEVVRQLEKEYNKTLGGNNNELN